MSDGGKTVKGPKLPLKRGSKVLYVLRTPQQLSLSLHCPNVSLNWARGRITPISNACPEPVDKSIIHPLREWNCFLHATPEDRVKFGIAVKGLCGFLSGILVQFDEQKETVYFAP